MVHPLLYNLERFLVVLQSADIIVLFSFSVTVDLCTETYVCIYIYIRICVCVSVYSLFVIC